MDNLSIILPSNEPCVDFRAHDFHWDKFSKALANVPKSIEIPMVINGVEVFAKEKVVHLSPLDGKEMSTTQQGNQDHAKLAISSALEAKAHWAQLPASYRIQKMRDLEHILYVWKYELCAAAALECGYTAPEVALSWAELMDFIRFNNFYYSELLSQKLGDGDWETNRMGLRPLKGFCCAVTPFNFPIAIGYHLPLVMALLGNTVVWKPSDDAIFTSSLLMKALKLAGFPPGVINMITGDGRGTLPLVLTHPELNCLNFTGSFATAKVFANYLFSKDYPRHNFPRFIAETGGKDFLYVDKSADYMDTAKLIVQGAFGRSGQKCSATSLLLVDEKAWHGLKEPLIATISALKLGSPIDRLTDLGPVINQTAFQRVVGYIERAVAHGNCRILAGANWTREGGYYIEPTLIEVSTDSHELLTNEIFGPVLAVRVVDGVEHALKIIQNHPYRLTGGVVSQNEYFLSKAVPLFSEYAGNFYINRKTTGAMVHQQPFGGDGASGTNFKAGGPNYLLNFVSQCTIGRRHARINVPQPY